jgi:hypothetical protein
MRNYLIKSDSKELPLIGATTLSTGDGLETKQRYGYDYSKKPQSLIFRKRSTALNATIQLVFNNTLCTENSYGLMDYISELESVCGDKVTVYWNDENMGDFIVTQAQFSAQIDPLVIYPQISVSLAFTEGYVKHETLQTKVGTLTKPS